MATRVGRVLAAMTVSLGLVGLGPSPSPAGLIGAWSFDGCTTTDASGNGHDLTAGGGPTCISGRFGAAWHLNGIDQYLDRAFDAAFTPGTRAWSVATWVRTANATGTGFVVEWYRCGANPACTVVDGAYYIIWLTDGHPYWDVRDDAAHDFPLADTTLELADGGWHFIVGTMNPATGTSSLYVDGALRATLHGVIGSLSNGGVPVPLEVGRHFRTGWDVPGLYFLGDIDEVRIYDDELDAASIASLYTNNAVTGVPVEPPSGLSIDGVAPNPSRGGRLAVTFTLPASGAASVSVFDICGRLVARREVGSLGAGRHRIDLAGSHGPAPGVYAIRLVQGDRSRVRRVSVLQ